MKFHYNDRVKVVGDSFYFGSVGTIIDCDIATKSKEYQIEFTAKKSCWLSEEQLELIGD